MAKAKIEKVVIAIGKKKIDLTTEEAQQLKEALDELFGANIVTYPITVPYRPWYWEPPQPVWTSDTIMCQYSGSSNTLDIKA